MAYVNNRSELIDKISQLLIENFDSIHPESTIENFQKVISGGTITTGASTDSRVIVFRDDVKANEEDIPLLDDIMIQCSSDNIEVQDDQIGVSSISNIYLDISGGQQNLIIQGNLCPNGQLTYNLADVNSAGLVLKDNISQYTSLNQSRPLIDPDAAEEVLDTSITELIPVGRTRQERIDDWFAEYVELKGEYPSPDLQDVNADGVPDVVTTTGEYFDTTHDISTDNPEGDIPRLEQTEDNINFQQTLEWLKNDLDNFFPEPDVEITPAELPEYEPKSSGYLKVRHLNQAIIVRKEEGTDIGIIGESSAGWGKDNPKFLQDGFTITMWVKFLDKVNNGTLFNFGNPFRDDSPFGFSLDTFVINKDDIMKTYHDSYYNQPITWGEYTDNMFGLGQHSHVLVNGTNLQDCYDVDLHSPTFFKNSDTERFLRLTVREKPSEEFPKGRLRDSHTTFNGNLHGRTVPRLHPTWAPGSNGAPITGGWGIEIPTLDPPSTWNVNPSWGHKIETAMLTHTNIPVDLTEWYFIVATYNPNILEDESYAYQSNSSPDPLNELPYHSPLECGGTVQGRDPDYWRGHIDPLTFAPDSNTRSVYTHKSGFGAKCKVEFISRSDLLKARGFNTTDSTT